MTIATQGPCQPLKFVNLMCTNVMDTLPSASWKTDLPAFYAD